MVRAIERDEVRKKIEVGSAVVVKALPASSYQDAHLPGALNPSRAAGPYRLNREWGTS